jgi:hypothetical protein
MVGKSSASLFADRSTVPLKDAEQQYKVTFPFEIVSILSEPPPVIGGQNLRIFTLRVLAFSSQRHCRVSLICFLRTLL